jgi:2-hydroxychromene-2-carboxylate isomerase
VIEFWFDFASNYSYLTAMRIEALAAPHGLAIGWRPFLLGPIFAEQGWNTSPFVIQKAKGAWVWKDMERQCAKYGLPTWQPPTAFPRGSILAARLGILADLEGWAAPFVKAVYRRNFVADQEIDSVASMTAVLDSIGQPAQAAIDRATGEANKLRLREQVALAQARGVFGAPTLFVGDEMFWGNDRLEDAIGLAAQRKAGLTS